MSMARDNDENIDDISHVFYRKGVACYFWVPTSTDIGPFIS